MLKSWCEYRNMEYVEGFTSPLPSENFEKGYEYGKRDALASQWKDPKVELPEDEEYVLIYSDRGIEPAVWNEHYQVWDDAEGDDYLYKKEYVKLWMSIPDIP